MEGGGKDRQFNHLFFSLYFVGGTHTPGPTHSAMLFHVVDYYEAESGFLCLSLFALHTLRDERRFSRNKKIKIYTIIHWILN
jgi:hypothetical protein